MPLPSFTMRQLLEAGVHFGHHTRRWNPKMKPYIFGIRNHIHILNLQMTVPMLYQALEVISNTVARNGRIMFVGTKPSASGIVAEAAKSCGQCYVNHRWLGGMMTNWDTVSQSIRRLKVLEDKLNSDEIQALTKKETLQLSRERDKLEMTLGGIKEMGGLPDLLFIIDTNKEAIAVAEANTLGIPVVAVVDSNANPDGVDYIIPGNDDAIRAISFYCDLISGAVIDGLKTEVIKEGGDLGEAEIPVEETLAEEPSKDKAQEAVETTGVVAGAAIKGEESASTPDVSTEESSKDEVQEAVETTGVVAEAAVKGDESASTPDVSTEESSKDEAQEAVETTGVVAEADLKGDESASTLGVSVADKENPASDETTGG